jgi:regulator of sigma E protease
LVGLFFGSPEMKPYISNVLDDYPAQKEGAEKGDLILSINGEKMSTSDDVLLKLELVTKGKDITLEIEKPNGDTKVYTLKPKKITEDGNTYYRLGVNLTDEVNKGFGAAINYAFTKFTSIFRTMWKTVSGLITGLIGLQSLAGPVGIYSIVEEGTKAGLEPVLNLVIFLSVNIGFINLLPFPAFDGGRVLFLIIEKIKGSKVNSKVENIIHAVGFGLLLLLMILITIQDIIKLLR